jgi:hypothetical protein
MPTISRPALFGLEEHHFPILEIKLFFFLTRKADILNSTDCFFRSEIVRVRIIRAEEHTVDTRQIKSAPKRGWVV